MIGSVQFEQMTICQLGSLKQMCVNASMFYTIGKCKKKKKNISSRYSKQLNIISYLKAGYRHRQESWDRYNMYNMIKDKTKFKACILNYVNGNNSYEINQLLGRRTTYLSIMWIFRIFNAWRVYYDMLMKNTGITKKGVYSHQRNLMDWIYNTQHKMVFSTA